MAQQNIKTKENERERSFTLLIMMKHVMDKIEPMNAFLKEKHRHYLFPDGFESVKDKLLATKAKFCPGGPSSVGAMEQWFEDHPVFKLNYWGIEHAKVTWLLEESGVENSDLRDRKNALVNEMQKIKQRLKKLADMHDRPE